jgi:hypothetical protein
VNRDGDVGVLFILPSVACRKKEGPPEGAFLAGLPVDFCHEDVVTGIDSPCMWQYASGMGGTFQYNVLNFEVFE